MEWNLPDDERNYIRTLAREQAGIAALPVMEERKQMWYALNDAQPGARPPVIIETWTFDRDFLPPELKTLLAENGVDACIAVQADQSETETLFLLDLAADGQPARPAAAHPGEAHRADARPLGRTYAVARSQGTAQSGPAITSHCSMRSRRSARKLVISSRIPSGSTRKVAT